MKKLHVLMLLCVFALPLAAQELDATVTVNYQNLPVVNKENLERFAEQVQTYLNNTRFTGNEWKFAKIKCTFNISLVSAESEINYTGQAVILSQRRVYRSNDISPMLRLMDNTWNFVYDKNQSLYYNPSVFHPLLSFFDYYAYLIIGLESDSWEKLSGTPFFNRASDIVNVARSSSQSKGWESGSGSYNRRDMIENLLNEKYRVVREGFADYHYAIDLLAQRPDDPKKKEAYRKIGLEKLVGFVKSMDAIRSKFDINSVFVRTFFDAKFQELVDKLRIYPDKNVFKLLKSIDPQHAAKYEEALRN